MFLSEEIKENNEGLYIIKLFPEQTCNICLRKDVVIFNELYKNYSNKINIYVLNQEGSDELERFGAKFEYKILNEEEANNLFEQDIYIGNPITFLMYNTTSIDYFETKITHLEQSDFFHNRMKTILSRTTEE
ncbi:MAG: hypothetical protein FH748_15195 [Balneolaceae bacterium]|nr:hypothetical protein [Balneolaceae bacterium]